MRLKYIVVIPFLALALAACANSSGKGPANALITVLSRISNTGIADLAVVESVAKAATPPDTDGYNCAVAATTVAQQIAALNAAANVSGAGALTLAEMASLFQPGSAQFNAAQNTLASGCVAKANDVLGPAGVVAAGGVIGVLAATNSVLPLAAAAP